MTIRSKFFLNRLAVQSYRLAVITIHSKIFMSRSGPSIQNFTQAIQPFRSTIQKFF